jgi:hypothetical protein
MCRSKKKVETTVTPAEALTAGTCIVDLSKYRSIPASALTNTLYATVVPGEKVSGAIRTVVFEQTVSFARSYFEAAMGTYRQARSSHIPVPNLLQQTLTSLNLGLSNLLGRQWREQDKKRYAERRQQLMLEFVKTKPNRQQIAAFRSKYPKIQKDRTFALSTLIGTGYPLGKGWSLEQDEPLTNKRLLELYNYCKDIAEHTEGEKVEVAIHLTLEEVEQHLSTAKRTVRWFLNHLYDGRIPKHAHDQYIEIFGEDLTSS